MTKPTTAKSAPPRSAPLLEHLSQSPLLIAEEAEGLFTASVTHLVQHERSEELLAEASAPVAGEDDNYWPTDPNDWRAAYRPYNVKDGVLQIPVMGVLLHRFSYQFGRWATGYAYIERAMDRGLADPAVKAIAFVIDSPGGEVAGCFELVDKIYEARGDKPIRAFAADHAYSAAYAVASSAGPGNIRVTRSGGVGSVGVVTAHVEYSKMMEDWGVKVTFIFAGKHKVEGNSYEALPDSVKARIQKRIDRIYGVFTSTVARNRDMDEGDVRATEALTYDAQDSIEVGFADKIGALEDEMLIFSTEAEAGDTQMANFTQEQHDAALKKQRDDDAAAAKVAQDAAVAKASADAVTADRKRTSDIMGSDEGKKRPKAAAALAKTGLSVEDANAALAEMPEEKAETPAPKADDKGTPAPKAKAGETPFDKAMGQGNPEVGADAGEDDGLTDDAKASGSILADYAGARGSAPKKAKAA